MTFSLENVSAERKREQNSISKKDDQIEKLQEKIRDLAG